MDKRGRERKKTRLPARFGVDRADKLGLITNVSSRGIYISTNAVLKSGSPLRVQVQVPGGEQLELQGRVIRARRVPSSLVMITTGGMAVRLEAPPPNWRTSLALPEDA
jgi:hypothetical protein